MFFYANSTKTKKNDKKLFQKMLNGFTKTKF